MASSRKVALVVGVLFIIGTVAGVLSGVVTAPILDSSNYLESISANNTQILIGALLVLTMGLALAMIPITLYPIFKRYNNTLAMGSVVFRGALETAVYIAMIVVWLLLIGLSQQYVNAGLEDGSNLQALGALLLDVNAQINPLLEIIFSLGALMIYVVFFQSRLIPRWLSGWGIAGALLYLAAGVLAMIGSPMDFLLYFLALQEMVLALWLIIKGFSQPVVTPEFA